MRRSGLLQLALIFILAMQFPGWTRSLGKHVRPPSSKLAIKHDDDFPTGIKSRQALQQHLDVVSIPWNGYYSNCWDDVVGHQKLHTYYAPRLAMSPRLESVTGLMSQQC